MSAPSRADDDIEDDDDDDEVEQIQAAAAVAPVKPEAAAFISEEEEKADEYKETYLTMWNNTTNPKEVSCRTAFDILCWCFGPVSQLRALYRTGNATTCGAQFADLQTCMKVKAAALKDPEEARRLLREDRRSKEDPRPHVWKFRTQPPEQFRKSNAANAAADLSKGIIVASSIHEQPKQ